MLTDVHHLSVECQHQLMNLLRTGRFLRKGSNLPVTAGVRLICSTYVDLREEAFKGRFLEPLAHTLESFSLHIPSLAAVP